MLTLSDSYQDGFQHPRCLCCQSNISHLKPYSFTSIIILNASILSPSTLSTLSQSERSKLILNDGNASDKIQSSILLCTFFCTFVLKTSTISYQISIYTACIFFGRYTYLFFNVSSSFNCCKHIVNPSRKPISIIFSIRARDSFLIIILTFVVPFCSLKLKSQSEPGNSGFSSLSAKAFDILKLVFGLMEVNF